MQFDGSRQLAIDTIDNYLIQGINITINDLTWDGDDQVTIEILIPEQENNNV